MLYSPARSPESDSSLLLRRAAKSLSDSALSKSVNRRSAWSRNPRKSLTRRPMKSRQVFRFLKLRINETAYVKSKGYAYFTPVQMVAQQAER